MQLELINIGPVRSARIDLHPLTVFVGPNNSGKSLAATVLYAVLSGTTSRLGFGSHGTRLTQQFTRQSLRNRDALGRHEQKDLFSLLNEDLTLEEQRQLPAFASLDEPIKGLLADLIERYMAVFSASVLDELERTVATSIKDLRRVQKRATVGAIRVSSSEPAWEFRIVIKSDGPHVEIEPPSVKDVWERIRDDLTRRLRPGSNALSIIARDFPLLVNRACFAEFPTRTRYLPAARSGLMQSHKVLAGTLIRRSSLAGLEDLRIPTMSGVVTDFLGELIELETRHADAPFRELGESLEREILHGTVQIDTSSSSYPELFYRTENGDFPLTRTSSMVSELAPVIVYLKRILGTRDFLFIEEPEAHLHPASQVILAQFIVRLVNAGLKIGLTTHSEFFLQQINNSIVAGDLTERRARSAHFDSSLRIQSSSVAAYFFKPGAHGTVVERIPATSREGIANSGFDSVSEMLYNQNVELDRQQDG